VVRAELFKLAGLPSVWVAAGLGLAVPPLLALLNSRTVGTGADSGYQELAFGVIGALVLGVVAAGSEYRGRQITTSLTCVPSRWRLLAAKTGALTSAVALLAALAAVATLSVTGSVGAAAGPRIAGVVCYWVFMALLAYGITLLTRSGILPLTILILNTSVVSASYLLTKVTPLAGYLPDLAGAHMFLGRIASPVDLGPLAAGLVMAAWVLAVLGVAAAVFHRRDA
jgi:ABC-2 type transport system permease protein